MAGSPDYGELISGIMSDPAAMSNVMKIAQSLMGNGGLSGASTASAPTPAPASAPDGVESDHNQDRSDFASFAPKNDEGISSVLGALPSSLTDKETSANRERLLVALKPYMGSERRAMIDTVLKLLRLAKIADLGKLLDGIK